MNIVEFAKARYATKKFDPAKKIANKDFTKIKELLRFSPSSVNSQPWHFYIAESQKGKQRLTVATQPPYAANEPKILDASHVVLFCAKTDISDEYLQSVTDKEDADGRFYTEDAKALAMQVRRFYADLHREDLDDVADWAQKQVYLNIGTLLLASATLGIDAVPIEGVDLQKLNQEFALADKGLSAVALVALGYRAEDDFNATLPKSRLSEDLIFSMI